jgi:hypothetical protein
MTRATHPLHALPPVLTTLSLALAAFSTHAAEMQLGEGVSARLDTTLSFGTILRTENPNPAEYGAIPSTVAGAAQGQLVGQTGGSDLNFHRGDLVSTVAQGMLDLSLKSPTFGAFARAAVWHDFSLGQDAAAYGNAPNGFAAGAPLSDHGMLNAAKFNGAMIRDAYVSAHAQLGSVQLDTRLGRQVFGWDGAQALSGGSWSSPRMIAGGVASGLNPNDYAAQTRPGALPEEAKVAVGMLSLHLASGKAWAADAFVPYETRQAVLPACGTFFDTVSIVPEGCNVAAAIQGPIAGSPLNSLASLTEHSLVKSGFYVHRGADAMPSARGQFGLGMHVNAASIGTVVSGYLLNTPATLPYYQAMVEDVGGHTLPLAPASVFGRLNPALLPAGSSALNYAITYPGSVRLYGLGTDSQIGLGTKMFTELSYRPSQPLSYNLNDMLAAFLTRSPNSLLAERRGMLAVPAGGTFQAYDRLGVGTATAGVNQRFGPMAGAQGGMVSLELGMEHVNDLPDPLTMRYGRSFAYGLATYRDSGTGALSACSEAAPGFSGVSGKTCTTDGFVTSTAWGWRMALAARYQVGSGGLVLTPSLTLADDVHGYAFDNSFSQGRRTLRPALRGDWGRGYYGQVVYTRFGGGNYNLMADRSNLMLAVGAHI